MQLQDISDNIGVAVLLTPESWVAIPYPKSGINTAFVEPCSFRRLDYTDYEPFFKGKLFNKSSAVLLTDYSPDLEMRKVKGLYEIQVVEECQ
jgi:hypothetical protein